MGRVLPVGSKGKSVLNEPMNESVIESEFVYLRM